MANSEYNLTVVDGTALTISLSGPTGPAGASATPAGNDGSVQYSNGTALVADSGLVYTGTGNTGVLKVGGGSVIMSDPTVSQNVAIGGGNPTLPLTARTTGNYNVSVGTGNLPSLTKGDSNVVIGTTVAPVLTEGYQNFGLGTNTLYKLTIGHNNVAIGQAAGASVTTGSQNILIGNTTGSAVGTDSTQIVIAGTSDGPRSTVIGYDGRLNELPTQTTRFIGDTITFGSGVASVNNRTSLVQSATTSAKTITLPNANGTVPVYTVAPTTGQVLTSSGTNGAATWTGVSESSTANTLVKRDANGKAGFNEVAIVDLDDSALNVIRSQNRAFELGSNIAINPTDRQLYFLSTTVGSTPNTYTFPDVDGTVPVVPAYVDLNAANAALVADDFWWDTTLKKLRRATA